MKMNRINVGVENFDQSIPDISTVFAGELKNIRNKLQFIKGGAFDIVMDTAYSLVYYALNMCIEYQKNADGTIPKNIVDEIWKQVLIGGRLVFKACEVNEFNEEMSKTFHQKLLESNIIDETIHFWEIYEL